MAGSQTLAGVALELGPLSVPVWLIAAAGGYIVGAIVRRLFFPGLKEASSIASDAIFTVVFVTLIVWKLSPVLTRWSEIMESPGRLIYYPGGLAAALIGFAMGVALALLQYLRRRRKIPEGDRLRTSRIVAAVGLALAFVLLPVGIVSVIPVAGQNLPVSDPNDPVRSLAMSAAGRPTVLVFWATWCGPCTAQMPEIERFSTRHGSQVQVIAVNLTRTEANEAAVQAYLDEYRLTVPVLLDKRGELGSAFGISVTPTTVILDQSGTEVFRRSGAVTSSWIERRVLPLRS